MLTPSPAVATLGIILALLALIVLWIRRLRRAVRRRTSQLRKIRHSLQVLFKAIPDLIFIKDQDGTIIESNRPSILVHGEERQVIGRTAADLLPESTAQRLETLEQEVMRLSQARRLLVQRAETQEKVVDEEITIVPLHDDRGQILGTLAVIRDISERTRLENQLRLWAHAIQHADFGIALLDAETATIAAANDSFAFERGYSPDELIGMPLTAFCPKEELWPEWLQLRELKPDEHRVSESVHVRRNGEHFPVLLDRSLYRATDKEPGYIVMYAQNITERRRAQTELRLAAVAFETHDATIVLDAAGKIQRVNTAFIELTGYPEDQVIGRGPFFLDRRMHDTAFIDGLREELEHRRQWKGELWIQVLRGKPRVVRVHISAVTDGRGSVSHYVCAMVDLTQEREAHTRADRLGFFDALTELPNRNHLFTQIEHLMEEAESKGGVLLVIDLDHFKRVNEMQGHATGDLLLNAVAQRLRTGQRENDTLARLSGGVFAWLAARSSLDEKDCANLALGRVREIRRMLSEPFDLDREKRKCSISPMMVR